MRRARLAVLAAAVLAALSAQAQLAGSAWVTGIGSNVSGANPFRFDEYRDLSSGATAGADVRCGNEAYWCTLFAENLGRDDQFAEARGGRYGLFKYGFFGNDTIHNLTHDAITPFEGVGTNRLTFDGALPLDTATWNGFDYSVKHRTFGGMFELRPYVSPFYARVEASRKESDGGRPIGGAGTSPGGPVYEMPVPVDWVTNNASVEAGYATRTAQLSVNAAWSRFDDHNDYVFWRNPIVTSGPNVESSTLAADNDLFKVGVNGMLRALPLSSTLAVRGTWSRLENSLPIDPTFLAVSGTTGATRLSNPSEPIFEGEVVAKSFSASLTSRPMPGVDSRLFWYWYERENNSTHLVFTPGGPGSGGGCDLSPTGAALPTCTPEHFHYTRNHGGLELDWRVMRGQKLSATIEWAETERERIDFDRNREWRATLEYKARFAEVDGRIKYQHLDRKSDFLLGDNADVFARYVYRFDAAPLDRDLVKLVLDASPTDLLQVGGEVILKRNKYKDTILGRTSDRRSEVYLTATYGLPEALRLTAFFDYEWTRYDSTHWTGATTTFPSPNAAGTAFLWDADVHDKNYLVGLAAEYPASERLKLVGSAIWQKTDGTVDFATPNNLGNPMPIDAYDSFRKTSLNLKALLSATPALLVTVGYAYENYDYDDVQMDGYFHTVRTGTTQNIFTGAYAFQSYKANVGYVTLTYRFP